jgi:UDP-2,3-diacylglucosamine pyrophosphatase LpxH
MTRKFNRLKKIALLPDNILPLSSENCYVVFSDHHKGDGSRADDFKKNAELYLAALSYYSQEGYKLLVLGDSEELWENDIQSILKYYDDIINQEIKLAPSTPEGRKIRVWGNHDKEVILKRFNRHLQALKINLFAEVEFREAVSLGGEILLVHGHQGRFFEDKAWRISRWAVHLIWKSIQKILNIGIDGPAENPHLRNKLEEDYYRWAKQNKIILICGHTHRAVFASLSHYHYLLRQKSSLSQEENQTGVPKKEKTQEEIKNLEKEIQRVLQKTKGLIPPSLDSNPLPCYFNSGCCGYTNGITALEIHQEIIRLIKWEKDKTRRVLQEGNLQKFIDQSKNQGSIIST